MNSGSRNQLWSLRAGFWENMGGGKQRIFGLEAFLVFELGGLQERLVAGRSARRPCDGSVTSKRTRWRQA